jgi:hypothetical protein
MSAITFSDRPAWHENLRFSTLFGAEPVYTGLALAMFLLLIPTGFAALVDERLVNGVNAWVKPLKFQVSIGVYLLTLAYFARFAAPGALSTRRYRAFALAVCGAAVAEIVWIMSAATFGVASHFNPSFASELIYPLMGALAVLLTSASAVQAWQIWRNPATGLSPATRDGVVLGLALVFPLTLVTAGTLSSMDGHLVGQAGGATVPLMGWAREAGDLRVAHFFATHAMHFVPVFAIVSALLLGPQRRAPVWLFALAFAAFTLLVLAQALAGRPLLPL